MNEKEELIIELEKKYEEKKSRLEELSEDELAKVGGGDGVVFEKGKWIRPNPGISFGKEEVYELLELKGHIMIVNIWLRNGSAVICLKEKVAAAFELEYAKEISRPSWAHE